MTARSAKSAPPRPARRTSLVRPPRAPRTRGGPRRLYAQAKRAWDRPLTAYYLILGGSLLITVLGLVMVYSASQIKALQSGLAPTFFFRKQLLAAVLGGGLLLVASRMSVKLHRAMAYPLLAGSVFLMMPGAGARDRGRGQRQPELDQPRRSFPDATERVRQTRARPVGRRPARPQTGQEAAGPVEASAGAAHPGRLPAARADHARRRHGHRDHSHGHPLRAALAGRSAHPAVRRACSRPPG